MGSAYNRVIETRKELTKRTAGRNGILICGRIGHENDCSIWKKMQVAT